MFDINKEEAENGIKCSWNVFPGNKLDLARYVVPLGIHYSPLKQIPEDKVLSYDPVVCQVCKSIIHPFMTTDYRAKTWECSFCSKRHLFPSHYSEHISETTLPAELMQDCATVEYQLVSKKESNSPSFIFLIDITISTDELQELKDAIQNVLSGLPEDCLIGIITFGAMCNVLEIGFSDFPKLHVFRGEKAYTSAEIQEQLGLGVKHDPRGSLMGKKFLVPLKECAFTINSFLDDLQIDYWTANLGERSQNCSGLAFNVAVSILESVCINEPCRILAFLGNACSVGVGKIVGLKKTELIRLYADFESGNPNTNYHKGALEYYESIAFRASKAGQIIDIFACSFDQVGVMEMKGLIEKTGGYMYLSDSFGTLAFLNTLRKLFELDDQGHLKMAFKTNLEVFTTNPIKIMGGLGHMMSSNQKNNTVSDQCIGQSGTKAWSLGGADLNSTYSILLDIDGTNNARRAIIQFQTRYIAGDRTTRLRVTTIQRKICNDLESSKFEVAQSFDQEAATILMARLAVDKTIKEPSIEVMRWLDKSLIRLLNKFAEYNKDDPNSFKLGKEFFQYPQFMFYLRKSRFLQSFNSSPDESTYYKIILMHENVLNATFMIQPVLFSYTAEYPEGVASLLAIENMKSDAVLLLDGYFTICVWHGESVTKWRDEGYHLNPDYEYIKQMLEFPQDFAQSLISERLPVPRFITCDQGSGQERYLKCILTPTNTGGNTRMQEEGSYFSDDVTLNIFMDHLKRKAVQS